MSKSSLNASFQPQQWINDAAVDCAPEVTFDAGSVLLLLNAKQVLHLVNEANKVSGRDLDILAEAAHLVGNGSGQHNGPFYVTVDSTELADFLFEVGIRDLMALTDDDMVHTRNAYAAMTAAPIYQ
jgi:hypothetical protein